MNVNTLLTFINEIQTALKDVREENMQLVCKVERLTVENESLRQKVHNIEAVLENLKQNQSADTIGRVPANRLKMVGVSDDIVISKTCQPTPNMEFFTAGNKIGTVVSPSKTSPAASKKDNGSPVKISPSLYFNATPARKAYHKKMLPAFGESSV